MDVEFVAEEVLVGYKPVVWLRSASRGWGLRAMRGECAWPLRG